MFCHHHIVPAPQIPKHRNLRTARRHRLAPGSLHLIATNIAPGCRPGRVRPIGRPRRGARTVRDNGRTILSPALRGFDGAGTASPNGLIAAGLATTGRPIAIASSTLFSIPTATCIGATATADESIYPLMSSTFSRSPLFPAPPGVFAPRRAADCLLLLYSSRASSAQRRKDVLGEPQRRLRVRIIAHLSAKDDPPGRFSPPWGAKWSVSTPLGITSTPRLGASPVRVRAPTHW